MWDLSDRFGLCLQIDGRINDPTHRMCDDVRDFALFFTQLWPEVVGPVARMIFQMFRLASLAGSGSSAMMFAYFGVHEHTHATLPTTKTSCSGCV